jgi:molecular chaperone HscB
LRDIILGVSPCWNCGASEPGRFCDACKALQPPVREYFAFFEVPPQLALDEKDLQQRFYALSRKLHPDLFSRKSPQEAEYALDATAVLNDAYRTLRDPISRAQYVLKLEGFDVGEQSTKDVPPELLEEVFELNMALEEANMGDPEAMDQVAGMRIRFEAMLIQTDAAVAKVSAAWDATHTREQLSELRGLLNRRKYITNLIDKANVPDRV